MNAIYALKRVSRCIDLLVGAIIFLGIVTVPGQMKAQVNENLAQAGGYFPSKSSSNNQAIIFNEAKQKLDSTEAQAQISGTVTDANTGKTMPGVNISVKGTTTGTSTGSEGNYELTVSSLQDTLLFSFVGYQSRQIPINGRSTINIQMRPQAISGKELVVIGYGKQEKRDVTGAISSVNEEDIEGVPVASAVQAMQGKVAGMEIRNDSGQPGDNASIRIRGNRSISASNNPLIVLDGIPFSGNISDINSSNIASIEVLKDASATAIYGSRGANGVILISTKRGQKGETNISYNAYYGITEKFGDISPRSREEYVQQRINVAKFYDNYTSDEEVFANWEWQNYQEGINTNWVDKTFQKGFRHNQDLSISGGDEDTRYLISGNFFDEKAIVAKGKFQKQTFRVNLDQEVNEKLDIGTSTVLTHSTQEIGEFQLRRAIAMTPLGRAYEKDGSLVVGRSPNYGNASNPLLHIIGDSKNEIKRTLISPNAYLEYNIFKGLSYRLNLGVGIEYTRHGRFAGRIYNNLGDSWAQQSPGNSIDYSIDNILSFSQDYGNHSLDFTGLFSAEKSRTEIVNVAVKDLASESQEFYNLGTVQEVTNTGSQLTEWGILSFMGRGTYGFRNKYLATLSFRADGSSRLSEGNKWGFFPSAALAWRLIEEPFLQNQNIFSNLKLRVSYGRTGNTAINPYQTKGTLERTSYNFGDSNAFGFTPSELANPELQWEVTTSTNVGVDFGLFENRLNGSVEVYQQNTSDLLLNRQIPNSTGFGSVLENVGKTRNTGIEISLNANPVISHKYFTWQFDLNFYSNTEKIVKLFNGEEDDVGNQWFVGSPINVWYDYKQTGIWQTDEKTEAKSYDQVPGTVKVKDQNNNGSIDPKDRVILGSPNVKWSGGWNNYFSYKGFDLSINTFIRWGQEIFNGWYEGLNTTAFARDESRGLDIEYWTPNNPVNTFPIPSRFNLNQKISALNYFDGSFIKIKDITLGYDFASIFKDSPLSKLRLYITAHNAFMFRKKSIPGISLDIEDNNGVMDINEVPLPKVFLVGLNLKF